MPEVSFILAIILDTAAANVAVWILNFCIYIHQ